MKRLFSLLSVLCLCAVLLVCGGCKDDPDTPDTPVSTALPEAYLVNGQWLLDVNEHWQMDENGRTKIEAHGVGGCRICGGDISRLDDGRMEVYIYDLDGHPTQALLYNADGMFAEWLVYETQTDDMGRVTLSRVYSNGVLVREKEYAINEGGMQVLVRVTVFHADGTTSVTHYDLDGNVIGETTQTSVSAITITSTRPTMRGETTTVSSTTATTVPTTVSVGGTTVTTTTTTVATTTEKDVTTTTVDVILDDIPQDTVIG